MAGRESPQVIAAAAEAIAHPERRLTTIAAQHQIAASSLKRALRRRKVPARPALAGADAPGYIDGRTLV